MEVRDDEDRGPGQALPHALMGAEVAAFPREDGQGEERGPYSPRVAKIERCGGRSQLWEMTTGSTDM